MTKRILAPLTVLMASASALPMAHAATKQAVLWQIGAADRTASGMALAPAGWPKYSQDGLFVVGRSDSRTAWPYVQPGPADAWAGSRSHAFTVLFGMRKAPATPVTLEIRILNAQAPVPPKIRIQVNGFQYEKQLTPGGGDDALEGLLSKARPISLTIKVPPTSLQPGMNRVTITTLSGSWMVYDSLKMTGSADAAIAPLPATIIDSVDPTPFLTREPNGTLAQVVRLHSVNFGIAAQAQVRIGAKILAATLPNGSSVQELLIPEVLRTTKARLTASVSGKTIADMPVTLIPSRHWNVYLLPHSHVDIGYTDIQDAARKKQIGNLNLALGLIEKTASYPKDAQFKWNLEGVWPFDGYLREEPESERRRFMAALQSGSLSLNGYYANLLTGLCSPWELIHASDSARAIADEARVTLDTAMQDDVPGNTWGNVTAMSQAGINYLSLGPNAFDRRGASLETWRDKPFYWISQSGKEKVLVWMTHGGYSLGNDLGGKLAPFLPGYLQGLQDNRYPYDIACLQWSVNGDNGTPDDDLANTVRDWNRKYAYPHLIIASTREPFVALEKRYGGKIPAIHGDFTPYWEDGAGSTAAETAINRATADRLAQAETMRAMRNSGPFPKSEFTKAWDSALLYSEHTWGAWNSISDPDANSVKAQWAVKQGFALTAGKDAEALLRDTLHARGAHIDAPPAGSTEATSIDVYNTNSWTRTDVVFIPKDRSALGDRVTDSDGKPVPSQRMTDGTLAVLASNIPSFASRRYTIGAGESLKSGDATAAGNSAHNGKIMLKIDQDSGAINEIRAAGIVGNLVDTQSKTAVNDYFYLLGGNVEEVKRPEPATVAVIDAGPLVATLRVTSRAPGCKSLTREVRIMSGIGRIYLDDTVDKVAVRAKEGIHIGFGFNVPNAVTRMDMPLSVIRPETDQIKASNKNWFPVQRWVDVSNANYGVTWATVDAPLVEIGAITATMPDFVPWNDPRWIQRSASSSTLYSWAMNNHWHTNYKAAQEGPVTFRYAIEPHGNTTPDAYSRFGSEVSRPLLLAQAGGQTNVESLLTVSSPGVTVLELKSSNDGRGNIVRLWGASGQTETVTLTWRGQPLTNPVYSDAQERELGPAGVSITVPGYGLVTLRVGN